MTNRYYLMPFVLALSLAGCSGDTEESGNPSNPGGSSGSNDLGGPHSLTGFEWKAEPAVVNGIKLQLGFSFDATGLTASNTCDGSVTVTTRAPVRYRYTATVKTGATKEEDSGGAKCFVEIASGTSAYEIVDNKMHVTFQDKTTIFDPVGVVAGLYGTWKAAIPDVGEIEWRLGGGKIVATANCATGGSATTEVNASFVNLLDVTKAASDAVDNGAGTKCEVAIAAGTIEYRFSGNDLVMIVGGQESVFAKK